MRERSSAQTSIFGEYPKHKAGVQFKKLSSLLDDHPKILKLIENDLVAPSLTPVGRSGLTSE